MAWPRPRSLHERLTEKFRVDEQSGCWVWTASKTGPGYGKISVNDRLVPAHRASYELFVGLIPAGLELDHLCRNKACVNPSHLEPVTHTENVRRARSTDACPQGHPRTPEHLYVYSYGRFCRTCHKARSRAKSTSEGAPRGMERQ